MEYSFLFRDIFIDIHQINSGYSGYSHEYSFLFLNISLVIPNNHMNIHLDSEYLYLKKNILAYFWIFRTPLTRRCRAAAPIASLCCPSATFSWILDCAFREASLNLKTFMSNKKKVFTKCERASPGALRRGTARGNAAPQPLSPGPIQPVRSSRHAHRLDAKHAEAIKPSILIQVRPTLFQDFVKLPCPCQVCCPGNLVWYHSVIWIFM